MTNAPQPGSRIIAKPSARRQFLATTLALEAFVVLFATLVAVRFSAAGLIEAPQTTLWIIGGCLMVTLLVVSRVQHTRLGIVAGGLTQVGWMVTPAFVDPTFLIVAFVFLGVWVASLVLGTKIDTERAHYDAHHPDTAPNVPPQ